MNTFFINTSGKRFDAYEVLFDIHYENRTLVSLDCNINDWLDTAKGYIDCVKKMGKMIDNYTNLNNAFNLIIYIDLSEIEAYTKMARDAFGNGERLICLAAMHILFKHLISETIIKTLVTSGRKPQDVLIMFGEDMNFSEKELANSDKNNEKKMHQLLKFIGLPNMETIENFAKEVDQSVSDNKIEEFKKLIQSTLSEGLIPNILESYASEIDLWYEEIITNADVIGANQALYKRICEVNDTESERIGIKNVSCPSDCVAERVNKSILTLNQLNLSCYLIQCVNSCSIYEEIEEKGEKIKQVRAFRTYNASDFARLLGEKKKVFAEKLKEIEEAGDTFAKLKLAPKILEFDNDKFTMDEFGTHQVEFHVNDEQENKDKAEQGGAEDTTAIEGGSKKVLTAVRERVRNLFATEFKLFDAKSQKKYTDEARKAVSPRQFTELAAEIKRYHLNFLKELNAHIEGIHSNYAGRSEENEPALLRKRKVSVAEEGFEDSARDYKYAKQNTVETRKLTVVKDVSETAYKSALSAYMEFCAARSVAVTNIEAQCNWFVTKINQINESLNRIKLVAVGLTIATLILYLPYLIIQWGTILSSLPAFAVAGASVAIPLVLLGTIVTAITIKQREKYREAWYEFEEKSDRIIEENRIAAEKYDYLLCSYIPALRWLYEYKLDVEFYSECCKMARAKINHHMQKLHDRVEAVGNILEDMETGTLDNTEIAARTSEIPFNEVDYNVAFCSGETNRNFYSIADEHFLNSLNEQKREA